MDQPAPRVYFLKCQSRDVDHLNAIIRGWDFSFRQLDRGEFIADVIQFGDRKHHFDYLRMNRMVVQGGTSPPGVWTFAYLTETSSPLIWREFNIQKDDFLIYSPNCPIEAQSRPGFEIITLSFSEEVLIKIGNTIGFTELKHLPKGGGLRTPNLSVMQNFRRYIQQFYREILNNPSITHIHKFSDALQYDIPRRLLETLESSTREERIPSFRMRESAMRRALKIITETPDEPPMVRELCRLAGASERLLRYAFLERFGVSPKAYLLAVRLNGVRKELRAADPVCTKVIDVANSWGFWHMGQFAADYRRLFGELPSETLGSPPQGLFENLMMIERNSPTPKISKSLGIISKADLLEARLNGARLEFKNGDPSSLKVIDVANRWGFWDMEQFVADYRRLFGGTFFGNAGEYSR